MRYTITTLLVLGLLALLTSCQSDIDKTNELAKGWNTWNTNSVLSHVLLPEGLAINLQLLDGDSGDILEDALIGRSEFDSMEHVTPGPHADDGSYTELTLEWRDIHIKVQSASVDSELYLLVTPINASPDDLLIVDTEMMWEREGEISIGQDLITGKTPTDKIELTVRADSSASTSERIKVSLAGTIGISSDAAKTVDEIARVVGDARTDFISGRSKYGDSSDLFDAMQTVLAWNVIYEPTNDRVITPVSRVWNVGWKGWILFEWDTYFAAYMHSLNNKELAYANVIAMTSEITDRGFVPNFASSRNKSEDRSEPPVGSFVVREIYRRYEEESFVADVFDDLLTWNRWWQNNRDVDGYLTWGSDPYERDELPEWLETAIGEKQGAMWESGLDNSPMFDDATHDSESHRLMQADVGLMSLYILDCKSLADLAGALGKHEIQAELIERARLYSEKLKTLWNDEFGLYLNKDLVTGSSSYRLSPTLFYPLLANVPDQRQAERMIEEHFYNAEEFWGEYIIPSIARNDEAFADNTYWRGRIWAPMNLLVYLGIRNYDLPDARKDLAEKSENLLLQSWLGENHVYENYNSETGQGNDAGMSDKFYHWGALLGFIGLMEEGHVPAPELPLHEVAQKQARNPNIVFVLTDQWRAQATGYGGDPNLIGKTPNLDQIANSGVNFKNAISTTPVCTPYRAALLTGQYPTTTGMIFNDLHLPEEAYTMAEMFKESGYTTAYVGKWHLDGMIRDQFTPPERRQGFEYWKALEVSHQYNELVYYEGDDPGKKQWPGYGPYAETDDAISYIQQHADGDKPFLLVLAVGAPHFPHNSAPEEMQALFHPEDIVLRGNVTDEFKDSARTEAAGYYAHIAAMDAAIGKLHAAIENAGIADDTIFVFTSDHGEMMGSQGWWPKQKQVAWAESVKVPFLLQYPARYGNEKIEVDVPINTPDILPTLLSMANLPIATSIQGEDMTRAISDNDAAMNKAALIMNVSPFAGDFDEYRGIYTSRYAYVETLDGPSMLFDMERDPLQLYNLVDNPEHEELQKELDLALQRELAKVGDDFMPRQYYIDKWNYKLNESGHIPYGFLEDTESAESGEIVFQGPSLNRQ